jgi:hypothetical protein
VNLEVGFVGGVCRFQLGLVGGMCGFQLDLAGDVCEYQLGLFGSMSDFQLDLVGHVPRHHGDQSPPKVNVKAIAFMRQIVIHGPFPITPGATN